MKISDKIQFLSEGKLQEKKFLIIVLIGIVIIVGIFGIYIFDNDSKGNFYKRPIKIKDPSSAFEDEKSLRIAVENKIKNLESENQRLNRQLEEQLEFQENFEGKVDELNKKLESFESGILPSPKQLNQQRINEKINSRPDFSRNYDNYEALNPNFDPSKDFIASNYQKGVRISGGSNKPPKPINQGIDTKSFEDVNFKNEFDVEEYLPAGSYASAKLLSSVDAGVGIASQSEPRPVLLRVKSVAYSAALKEDPADKQETDIRGCMITGEARGDLSSERGYIRLLDMTCYSDANKVTETKVHGFVSSLGKAGIRGLVIEREDEQVVKAFMAGIFSSLGQGVEERYSPSAQITGSTTTIQRGTDDILRSGVGGGIGKSLDRLSQYYIDRMEQIQPVISLPQGLDIEVIFTKGSFLDGRKKGKGISATTSDNINQNIL